MKRNFKPTFFQGICILAGVLVALYITDLLVQRTKITHLQIFVSNDDSQAFNANQMEKELAEHFSLTKDERVIVDDSLYVVLGSSDHYVESSLSKIYAYMAAKELDVLIAPLAVATHYTQGLPMLDYPTLLSQHPQVLERLLPYLSMMQSIDGIQKKYLLDVSQSRYKPKQPMYMVIPQSAPHIQAVITYLEYLFPLY